MPGIYFFSDTSVFIIEKFKVLQSIFGIREYEPGMVYGPVLAAILAGNIISTISYFGLGYLKGLIPLSIISGFFVIVFLFSGIIRHGTAIPAGVIILSSMEMFYRMLTISLGEFIAKNKFKNKVLIISVIILIVAMLLGAVFYEMKLIFG